MLPMHKHKSRLGLGLLGVATVGVMLLGGGGYFASRSFMTQEPSPSAVGGYASMLDAAPPAAAAPSNSAEPVRPLDIDTTEWQHLMASVANHPERDIEIKRGLGYLRFKHDLDLWTAMKDRPNSMERAQVGQRVLDALPVRFANQDVTGPDALLIQSAIYGDMIPDEAQRQPLEDAARQALLRFFEQSAAMSAKLQAVQEPDSGFKAREAEIMKRFKDQLIDQSQMQKELDAARLALIK